jgi:hypothetical protein
MITAIKTARNAWKFDLAGLPINSVLHQMPSADSVQNTIGLIGITNKRSAGWRNGIDSI